MLKKEWLRWVADSKGSAMVLVIIAIVILSTLGLAVLSLSVANLKVSRVDEKANLSFYMAESGLEQAHEIILNDVRTAVIEANKVVNDRIKDFIAAERARMLTESGYKSAYIIGNDPNGSIDVDKIKAKLKTPTDPEYQAWLTDYQNKYKAVLSGCLVANVNNEDNHKVIDSSVSTGKPTIKVEKQTTPLFSGNNCELTVSSLFDKEEYLQGKTVSQKVEADFNIKVPDEIPDIIYTNDSPCPPVAPPACPPAGPPAGPPAAPPAGPPAGPPAAPSPEDKTIDDNPIFDNVFVAAKSNLLFEGYTKLKINGNCYAYGTSNPDKPDNLEELGGFILQKAKNKITINGDLATYHTVQHRGTYYGESLKSENAWLKVNGNIYAEHLLINEKAKNTEIEVKSGNVYTSKNIVMYGEGNSKITVAEDWYGTTAASQKVPDSETKIFIKNEYKATDASSINKLTEMKKKQFADINKYITDVGEIIPEEIAKKDVIKDEVVLINNNASKVVYVVGSEMHGYNFGEGALKVKLARTPTKGIIISKGPIILYGTINFSGLIVSKQGKIEIRCNYDKEFNANRTYLENKAYELAQIGKNPFKYKRPAGDSLPWPHPAKKQVSGTTGGSSPGTTGGSSPGTTGGTGSATDIGIGGSIGLDPYKALISVGNWRKL